MLQVEGQKMSKSVGNFITIRQLFEGWRDFRWPGEAIKLAMLSTHYRQPIDWTVQKLEQACIFLSYAKTFSLYDQHVQPSAEFVEALKDDLNTPRAIAILHELLDKSKGRGLAKQLAPGEKVPVLNENEYVPAKQLSAGLRLLGIDLENFVNAKHVAEESIDREKIFRAIDARIAARKAKNWAEADSIRDELVAMGIILKDSKNPETGEIETTWEIAR